MKAFIVVLVASVLFVACAHHRDVRPGVDGINTVMLRHEDKEGGAREAIDQANHFCKESNRYAAFIEEKQEYTGDMDEKDYQTGKKITTVAKVVGGGVYVLGGRAARPLGGIVGLGGVAGDAALGEGYSVTMKFKCQ